MAEEKKPDPKDHPVFIKIRSIMAVCGGIERQDDFPKEEVEFKQYIQGMHGGLIVINTTNNDWETKLEEWSQATKSFVRGCSSYLLKINPNPMNRSGSLCLKIHIWTNQQSDGSGIRVLGGEV